MVKYILLHPGDACRNASPLQPIMIKTFAHKALERYYFHGDRRGLNARHVPRIERILDRLNAALSVADMNLPGYGLHRLSGNRQDTYSVKVLEPIRKLTC